MEFLKNCSSVYIDVSNADIVNNLPVGKIIVSRFPILESVFAKKGIVHILNGSGIPEVDCIISESRSIEDAVIKSGLKIPVIYLNAMMKWCGVCGSYEELDNYVSKYCSEDCMSGVCKEQPVKDLSADKTLSFLNKSKNVLVNGTDKFQRSTDKFQKSMIKDATRLEYAMKRESYKKEMRQPSLRKISSTVSKTGDATKLCKSVTKKGKKCTNKAIGSSDYCGIISHTPGEVTVL
jgi:hypothetical protein